MSDIEIEARVLNEKEMKAKFKSISRTVNKEIRTVTLNSALRIQKKAKDLVPVDLGKLQRSIDTMMIGNIGVIYTETEYSVRYMPN